MKAMAFVVVLSMVLLSAAAFAGEPTGQAEQNEATRSAQAERSSSRTVDTDESGISFIHGPTSQGSKAEVPGVMSFSGTLVDTNGVALDTTISMTFSIYTDSIGGIQVWTETQPSVEVTNGLYNVLLGTINSIADTVFQEPTRWFGLQVGADAEMEPRERLAAVAYAFRAAEADTADYARSGGGGGGGGWVDDGPVIRLGTEGDSVGIGTANPIAKLHVVDESGNFGYLGGANYALFGEHSSGAYGVLGYDIGGVYGSGSDYGVYGWSSTGGNTGYLAGNTYGAYGKHASSGNYGFLGGGTCGVYGYSDTSSNYAAYFDGRGYFSDDVGIGTTSPAAKLDVQGTVNVGQDSSGYDVNLYGGGGLYGGARFFWDEDKMALRVGRDTDGTYWAPDSVGYLSLAIGDDTKASGLYSTAMGGYTTANGDCATAMGLWTRASGDGATAMGGNTIASGDCATAMGYATRASSNNSTAMGERAIASGSASAAIGQRVQAGPAFYTMVLGRGNYGDTLVNDIENSLMVGFNSDIPTLFVGPSSGAGTTGDVGIGTSSPEGKLHVVGNAKVDSILIVDMIQPSEGTLNVGVDGTGYDVNFYGADSGSRFFWDKGKMALRAGVDTDGSHWDSSSVGSYSVAIGYDAKASQAAAIALGLETTASGLGGATAIGSFTTAYGSYGATAMGDFTTASGSDGATAMGQRTTASGNAAIAIGRDVEAHENESMVLGTGAGIDVGDTLVNYIQASLMVGFNSDIPTLFVGPSSGVGTTGDVGIGTADPSSKLHVDGAVRFGNGVRNFQIQEVDTSDAEGWSDLIDWGGIGIGSNDGANRQMIMFTDGYSSQNIFTVATSQNSGSTWEADFVIRQNGNVGIGTTSPGSKLDVNGTTTTDILAITGGSDLAEPFAMSDGKNIPEGALVVIDDENPGKLRMSSRPYDQRVAGVVSGAGGINPGITLSQPSLVDDGRDVALSGRVYALADATNGSIHPGDLLTTSGTPGHAMKATDRERSHGSIIGKAMSSLEDGQGLVLVLVNLQ